MKGLLYCGFLLNKKWFLSAGIIAVLGTAVCFFLYGSFQYSEIIVYLIYTGAQGVVAVLCTEWLGRSLESNIKCRFADYVLTSGISKRTFVLTELVKNIISIAISYAMCMVIQLVMRFRALNFFVPDFLLGFILIVGVLRWITSLVTIRLRSAEKAGLIVFIAFVLVVVLPYIALEKAMYIPLYYADYYIQYLIWCGFQWLLHLLFYVVIAAAYGIVYALFLRRVRKGDVCR